VICRELENPIEYFHRQAFMKKNSDFLIDEMLIENFCMRKSLLKNL
jgi:hypothetical protein